ncbi:MAG TPA: hypothetical protein VEC11_03475 [Allosphingosinicella sp.]|nr:hypothetical protein [Allosphingosinicella sp.]
MAAFACLALLGAPATASQSSRREVAQALFEQRALAGAIVVQDVRTGREIVSASIGEGARELPLSVAKLLLVALYWEHRRELPAPVAPDMDRIVALSADNPGRRLALELREALGSRPLLRDLARLGFPACTPARPRNCTTLAENSPASLWAESLSLGEVGFRTTLPGLSRFLRMIGNGGVGERGERVISAATARLLRQAMLRTVEAGTARRSRGRLRGLGRMGGKTGTGPAGPRPYDGIFAGLIFGNDGNARFTVVTYVRRGGGGVVAAEISAEMGARLLAGQSPARR